MAGSSRTTITDIARELNLSASTVSRALSGHPRISEATKTAVQQAAKRLNYRQNSIAAALRSGRSYIVGVLVPTANRTFFSGVVRGIEEVASAAGYSVVICQTHDSPALEERSLETLMRLQVDGILASISMGTKDFRHFHAIREAGVPLVLYDRVSREIDSASVEIDDYRGAHLAVSHLIEQGYRRIAILHGPEHVNIYQARRQAYLDLLAEHKLPAPKAYRYPRCLSPQDGVAAFEQFSREATPPDAVFSASDYGALGLVRAAKARGLRVGPELGVVGFANEPFAALVEPAISSVEQHSFTMGKAAASAFLAELERGADQSYPPHRTVLEPRLIIRDSSLRLSDPTT